MSMQYNLDTQEDTRCSTENTPLQCAFCEIAIVKESNFFFKDKDFCSCSCMNLWKDKNKTLFEVEVLDRKVHLNFRVLANDEAEAKRIALNQIQINYRSKAKVVFVEEV